MGKKVYFLLGVSLCTALELFCQFTHRNVPEAFEIDSITYDSTSVVTYYPSTDTLYDITGYLNGDEFFGQRYNSSFYLNELYYNLNDISLDIKFDPSGFFIRYFCVRTPDDTSGHCYELSLNHKIKSSFNSFDEQNGVRTKFRFGRIFSETEYQDGKKNGFYKEYSLQGKLIVLREYKNGKLNGVWLQYDGEGNIIVQGKMRNNQFDGILVRYNEDGSVREIEHWEDGEKRE